HPCSEQARALPCPASVQVDEQTLIIEACRVRAYSSARFLTTTVPQDFAFFAGFDLAELLRATAWRTSALKEDSSTSSPSWMSIARRTFPSRLELKRRTGSLRNAPLAKVSFTTFL